MPETLIIYGAMLLFGGIGVFFLVMWDLYARRYKNKYPLEVSARTVKVLGSRSNSPTIFYEAEMDGRTETFIESSGLGLPSYVPRVGDEVTLRIHPDPERIDSVGIDFKNLSSQEMCVDFQRDLVDFKAKNRSCAVALQGFSTQKATEYR